MDKLKNLPIALLLCALCVSVSASQQGDTFLSKLRAQETRDHKDHLKAIQEMSDSEYSIFLRNRIEDEYGPSKESLSALVVIASERARRRPVAKSMAAERICVAPPPARLGIATTSTIANSANTVSSSSSEKPR